MSNLSRRSFLSCVAAGVGASIVGPSAACCAAEGTRKNVLFVAADDLRPLTNAYGYSWMKTPVMDSLAAEGVVFNRHFVSISICLPSRVALMTGVRPDTTHQLWDAATHHFHTSVPGITTMEKHFRDNGYHTVSLGKIYHGTVSGLEAAGFHGFSETPWKSSLKNYALPANQVLDKATRPAVEVGEGVYDNDAAYKDGDTADKAIEKLGELKALDKPFWLGVGFHKPHLPFACPKQYFDLYSLVSMPLFPHHDAFPLNMPVEGDNKWHDLKGYESLNPADYDALLPDSKARELIHGYAACTSFVDTQLGKVLAELKRLDLYDSTIIVLWGDHGFHLGEHKMWAKATNFDVGTLAPLIVSAPGLRSSGETPRLSQALTETVDIFPTLTDLCGIDNPTVVPVEGTSFKSVLRNPDVEWKPAAFSLYNRGAKIGYSMRTDQYRYTEWVTEWDSTTIVSRELYDYKTDPDETVNWVDDPAYASIVPELQTQLRAGWTAAVPDVQKEERTPAAGAAGLFALGGLLAVLGRRNLMSRETSGKRFVAGVRQRR